MKSYLRAVMFCALLSVSDVAHSCSLGDPIGEPDWEALAKFDSITYLVAKSEIYLATALYKTTINGPIARFGFRVDRVLRGKARDTLELEGGDLDHENGMNFNSPDGANRHIDPEFWASREHYSVFISGCTSGGLYRVGGKYLLFINEEKLRRSFEPIKDDNDLWLKTVEIAIEEVHFREQRSEKSK